MAMDPGSISNRRLAAQRIVAAGPGAAKDVVAYMGAMQAQDYNMAKWAVGIRLPGSTDSEIEEAFNRGDVLRTHLLRPTWHLVSAEDIGWMLELSAPHILASMRARHGQLGLTDAVVAESNSIIENALSGGKQLTRDELAGEIRSNGLPCDSSQAYHLLALAELAGIACSGAVRGKEHTYALLAERVPRRKRLSRGEALGELAVRYFRSHGPATLQDFSWWSGLPAGDAKKALEAAGAEIVAEKAGSRTYWSSGPVSSPETRERTVRLLPAYDEFVISYRDRSPSLPAGYNGKAVSSNGVFRPVVVVGGQVAGVWRRTVKKDRVVVEIDPFQPLGKAVKSLLGKEAAAYGGFLNLKAEMSPF